MVPRWGRRWRVWCLNTALRSQCSGWAGSGNKEPVTHIPELYSNGYKLRPLKVSVLVDSSPVLMRSRTFEVSLHTGELRQRGQKVKLQEQPLQLLAALLERPGELVTREELRGKLCPADTFVDFDHSLNAAIKRLRDALGESAERPIFVETVARRGYRFIGNVEISGATPTALSDLNGLKRDTETGRIPTKMLPTNASALWARKWQVAGAVLMVLVLAGLVVGWFAWHRASRSSMSQPLATPQRLTSNPTENPISAMAISPDGKYLAYSDKTGTYLRLMSTGEVHPLLSKNTDVQFLAWYPDSTQLLAAWSSSQATKMGLWVLSILGGNPRQVSDEGWSASVSPDGSQIAYLKSAGFGETGQEIWLMRADGTDQRKIISLSEDGTVFASPAWSPDGRWIAYVKLRYGPYNNEAWIELFNLEHRTRSVAVAEPRLDWALKWLADGRLLYSVDEPPPSQNTSN